MARQFNGGNCGNCSENTPKMHFNDRSFFLAVPKPTTKNAILLKSHFSHLFNGSNSDWRREKKTSAHSRLVPSEQEQQQKTSYPLANMARKKNAFQQIHFHHSFFPIPIFISKYMNDSSVEQSRKWVAMEIKKKTQFSVFWIQSLKVYGGLSVPLLLFFIDCILSALLLNLAYELHWPRREKSCSLAQSTFAFGISHWKCETTTTTSHKKHTRNRKCAEKKCYVRELERIHASINKYDKVHDVYAVYMIKVQRSTCIYPFGIRFDVCGSCNLFSAYFATTK